MVCRWHKAYRRMWKIKEKPVSDAFWPSTNPVPPRELQRVLFKQVITHSDLSLNIFQIQDDWSAQNQILSPFFMVMLSTSNCWLGDTNTCWMCAAQGPEMTENPRIASAESLCKVDAPSSRKSQISRMLTLQIQKTYLKVFVVLEGKITGPGLTCLCEQHSWRFSI